MSKTGGPGTNPTAHLGRALRALDEERMEIVADGHRQIEYVERLTRERLALHTERRRALLGLFAAAMAGAATDAKQGA